LFCSLPFLPQGLQLQKVTCTPLLKNASPKAVADARIFVAVNTESSFWCCKVDFIAFSVAAAKQKLSPRQPRP